MKSHDLKSMILTNLTMRYSEKLPETPMFLHKARSENSKSILLQLLRDSNYDIQQFAAITTVHIKQYRGDRLDIKREVLSSEISNCIEQIELLRSEEYSPSYLRLFFDEYAGELENIMIRVNTGEICQVLDKGEHIHMEYRTLNKIEADLLQYGSIVLTFDIDFRNVLDDINSWDLGQPYIEKKLSKNVEGFNLQFRIHIYLSQEERIRKLENSLNLAQEDYELLNDADKLYYELLEALDLKYMAGEYVSLLVIEKEQLKLRNYQERNKNKEEKDCDYCCHII